MRLRNSLILCAIAMPAVAFAGQLDHWYITPEVGGISPNYQRSLEKNDWLYGLAFGRELNRYFNLELNLDGTRLSGRYGADSINIYATTLDALAVLNRSGTISPYLRLGAGFVHDVPGGGRFPTRQILPRTPASGSTGISGAAPGVRGPLPCGLKSKSDGKIRVIPRICRITSQT